MQALIYRTRHLKWFGLYTENKDSDVYLWNNFYLFILFDMWDFSYYLWGSMDQTELSYLTNVSCLL